MKPESVPDLDVEIAVEFGRVRLPIDRILNLREGSLIETGRKHAVGEEKSGPYTLVDVRLSGERFAVGEVVTIGEKYGVRILGADKSG